MIPGLVDGRLPVGEWEASWGDIESAFGSSQWRRHLLDGCRRALVALQTAGCHRVWIDGSFVTAKAHPGDIDGCYDPIGVDRDLLPLGPIGPRPGAPGAEESVRV